ncbi:Uma2 family endonuclease [Synechococcales cyanobacterium C]|uniref:Uma2 family endonuclease n=2 Tax=Petrachloros TaxID=2918834 RepID=A0A8K1ZY81_9CYAN|nr:Uma2 family endonuclease [Petrachloros mirabilis]NCJ06342.1 Uma2 family endonuclease [Petrachloros mirabilis ULC683]
MAQALEQRIYTPDEYLELELEAETRSEFRNGVIIPMTGGTPDHNELAINLAALLKLAVRGKPYRIFAMDQRLWIPDRQLYTYPDVMVIAKPLQLQAGRKDTVTNPGLIAEVLSPSTHDYDHGAKFSAYRTLDSFQEYLLIDQYRIHVEHYVKTAAHQWLLSEYADPGMSLALITVEVTINILDLYENIDVK